MEAQGLESFKGGAEAEKAKADAEKAKEEAAMQAPVEPDMPAEGGKPAWLEKLLDVTETPVQADSSEEEDKSVRKLMHVASPSSGCCRLASCIISTQFLRSRTSSVTCPHAQPAGLFAGHW